MIGRKPLSRLMLNAMLKPALGESSVFETNREATQQAELGVKGNEWDYVKVPRRSPLAEAGFGVLRATLLFSSVAMALTLLIVPAVDKNPRLAMNMSSNQQLDMMTTGSVMRGDPTPTYTLRRSVLQSSPDAICRINADGSRSGAC